MRLPDGQVTAPLTEDHGPSGVQESVPNLQARQPLLASGLHVHLTLSWTDVTSLLTSHQEEGSAPK